jgi:hypothetical protein
MCHAPAAMAMGLTAFFAGLLISAVRKFEMR